MVQGLQMSRIADSLLQNIVQLSCNWFQQSTHTFNKDGEIFSEYLPASSTAWMTLALANSRLLWSPARSGFPKFLGIKCSNPFCKDDWPEKLALISECHVLSSDIKMDAQVSCEKKGCYCWLKPRNAQDAERMPCRESQSLRNDWEPERS